MDRAAYNAMLAQYAVREVSGDGQVSWDGGVRCVLPSVKMYGKCEQETLTGKNLVADILDAYNSSGSTATSTKIVTNNTWNKILSTIIPVSAGERYTISWAGEVYQPRYYWFDEEPIIGETISIGGGTAPANKQYTATAPSDAKYLFVVFTRNAGDYISGNYQIEIGPTATAYEPYCGGVPAPNPSYPMPIKCNNGAFLATDEAEEYDGGQATAPDLRAIPGTTYRDEWDAQTGRGIRRCAIIESYAGEGVTTPYISSTGELSDGATVIYGIPDTPFTATPSRLTMPRGVGHIIQTGGDVADCPITARYLTHS